MKLWSEIIADANAQWPKRDITEAERLDRLEKLIGDCIKESGFENVLAAFVNATEGKEGGEAINNLYLRMFKR